MTPTDYVHARQILVGAFIAASNVEAQLIIFNAQQELFLEDFAKSFITESSIQGSSYAGR